MNTLEDLNSVVKVEIKLPIYIAIMLKDLAEEDGITANSVLHSAIVTYHFLRTKVKKGATLFIKQKDELKSLKLNK